MPQMPVPISPLVGEYVGTAPPAASRRGCGRKGGHCERGRGAKRTKARDVGDRNRDGWGDREREEDAQTRRHSIGGGQEAKEERAEAAVHRVPAARVWLA